MTSFRDILAKYSYSNDTDTTHSYGETYQSLFTPIQQNVLNILLIGVEYNNYLGGFLYVCKEFFPNATFTVVDHNSSEKFGGIFLEPDVTLYTSASIHDHDFVTDAFVNPGITFDIIIEDVSPRALANMAMVVKEYSILLSPGGMMFIEDLEYPGNAGVLDDELPAILKGCSQIIDLRQQSGRYDDMLYLVTAPLTMPVVVPVTVSAPVQEPAPVPALAPAEEPVVPVEEPAAAPAAEPAAAPVVPVEEPAAAPAAEPATVPVVPVDEPASAPASEPASEPSAAPVVPVDEPAPAPVDEPAAAPASEPAEEPVVPVDEPAAAPAS